MKSSLYKIVDDNRSSWTYFTGKYQVQKKIKAPTPEHKDAENYLLFPLSNPMEQFVFAGTKYNFQEHHLSIFEKPITSGKFKNAYHYSLSVINSKNNKSYKLHIFVREKGNVVVEPLLIAEDDSREKIALTRQEQYNLLERGLKYIRPIIDDIKNCQAAIISEYYQQFNNLELEACNLFQQFERVKSNAARDLYVQQLQQCILTLQSLNEYLPHSKNGLINLLQERINIFNKFNFDTVDGVSDEHLDKTTDEGLTLLRLYTSEKTSPNRGIQRLAADDATPNYDLEITKLLSQINNKLLALPSAVSFTEKDGVIKNIWRLFNQLKLKAPFLENADLSIRYFEVTQRIIDTTRQYFENTENFLRLLTWATSKEIAISDYIQINNHDLIYRALSTDDSKLLENLLKFVPVSEVEHLELRPGNKYSLLEWCVELGAIKSFEYLLTQKDYCELAIKDSNSPLILFSGCQQKSRQFQKVILRTLSLSEQIDYFNKIISVLARSSSGFDPDKDLQIKMMKFFRDITKYYLQTSSSSRLSFRALAVNIFADFEFMDMDKITALLSKDANFERDCTAKIIELGRLNLAMLTNLKSRNAMIRFDYHEKIVDYFDMAEHLVDVCGEEIVKRNFLMSLDSFKQQSRLLLDCCEKGLVLNIRGDEVEFKDTALARKVGDDVFREMMEIRATQRFLTQIFVSEGVFKRMLF